MHKIDSIAKRVNEVLKLKWSEFAMMIAASLK